MANFTKVCIIRLFATLCLFHFLVAPTYGFEIYRFVNKTCEVETGQIVNADSGSISLLTLEGKFTSIPHEALNHILIYNLITNPTPEIALNGQLKDLLREVFLSNGKTSNFLGWPIRFIEEFVVFYDLEGKTYFVETDKIYKISRPAYLEDQIKPTAKFERVHLGVGNNLPECPQLSKPHENQVQPTRMISDKIRISKFLSRYQKGFADLVRFQERTRFYAKPFLYESETQMGLMYMQEQLNQELVNGPPFYFQWSNGKPYSHQSLIVLGAKPVEWLPEVEPVFAIRTDVKSHFFNASFVGNPIAMTIGKGFIVDNRIFFEDFLKRVTQKRAFVMTQFNYLAVTGFDWDAFSFSGGLYYPILGIHGGGVFREVLATEASPIFRFLYTKNNLQLRFMFSQIERKSDSPNREDIILIYSNEFKSAGLISPESLELQIQIEEFALESSFSRIGFDYNINKEIKIGVDEVFLAGQYQDRFPDIKNELSFNYSKTSAYIRHQFGNYIVLKGYLNYFLRNHSYQFNQQRNPNYNDAQYSWLMAISFFL